MKKDFITKETLITGLCIGLGVATSDLLSDGSLDWIRTIVITLIATGLYVGIKKLRKK